MTVMILALILSDTTLATSDYRLVDEQRFDTRFELRPHPREWKPGVDGWKIENRNCRAFVRQDIGTFGVFSAGPRCKDEEIPYAL